jgi:hypothetical protein
MINWRRFDTAPMDGSPFVHISKLVTMAVNHDSIATPQISRIRRAWLGDVRDPEHGHWSHADAEHSFHGFYGPHFKNQAWATDEEYAYLYAACGPWREAPVDRMIVFFRPGFMGGDATAVRFMSLDAQQPIIECVGPRAKFVRYGRSSYVFAESYLDSGPVHCSNPPMHWCHVDDFMPAWFFDAIE